MRGVLLAGAFGLILPGGAVHAQSPSIDPSFPAVQEQAEQLFRQLLLSRQQAGAAKPEVQPGPTGAYSIGIVEPGGPVPQPNTLVTYRSSLCLAYFDSQAQVTVYEIIANGSNPRAPTLLLTDDQTRFPIFSSACVTGSATVLVSSLRAGSGVLVFDWPYFAPGSLQ